MERLLEIIIVERKDNFCILSLIHIWYDFNEDLYVPGYFEVDIKKGESIVFSAGISETSPRKLKQTFEAEVADRTPRDSFYHCLKNSAHQFHNKQGEEHYILAGYPWFKCRARDLFISLPGLTPVSYTHLDVYKRQLPERGDGWKYHYLSDGEPGKCF